MIICPEKSCHIKVTRFRKQLGQGHDPKVVCRLEKQATMTASSLNGLFELWYEAYCVKNKKCHHEIKRSFGIHVFPRIGDLTCRLKRSHTSLADYDEELTTETSEVPGHLAYYIDYDRMGRDMEMSGDIFTVET